MKKNLTEMVFVLDRSGSMAGLENDTIGGFNSLVKKQKGEEGDALVTTVLFDDQIEVLHDRIAIKKVPKMTEKQYYVRGCTALLDAVGSTIAHISAQQKEMPKDQRPNKTIVVITTDGMENASREYQYATIKKMIQQQKKKEWEFLFLGANIDAIQTANDFGINPNCAVNYHSDSIGTQLNYQVLAKAVSKLRKCEPQAAGAFFESGEWKEEIEADYLCRNV